MSDFILDFRDKIKRNTSNAIEMIRYFKDINICEFKHEKFSIILSRADELNIWGPYSSVDGNVFVALSGRIALEYKEWIRAKECEGAGGLACKAIYMMYKLEEISSLEKLNGNYAVFVFDQAIQKFYIILDRCGMVPCFSFQRDGNELILGSQPDMLATIAGFSEDWDLISISEFLMTGKVTFPYSYYNKIQAIDYGCIHTINIKDHKIRYETKRKYFDFNFEIDNNQKESDLVEELAEAFSNSVNKRTNPIFGQTAISLSGGLDSRLILCSANNKNDLWAFCFYDNENLEYRIAKEIAEAAGVKFIPLKRDLDYYANNAEMGVKISGATGNIFNNHYLGFRESLSNFGVKNILAGFYVDRLFKGYVLDKKINRILRTEKLSPFNYVFNQPIYWFDTIYSNSVKERLDTLFPENIKNDLSDIGKLKIEQRRIFPLYSESENPTTIIPQRVFGWYLPTIDNEILNVYLKTPLKFKLNALLYSKLILKGCDKSISKIINVNTGTIVNASRLNFIFHNHKRVFERQFSKFREGISTDESWPNWQYYIHNSKKIESLWINKKIITEDLFKQILGKNRYKEHIKEYKKNDLTLFMRLFTMKLWLEQRA